MTRLVLLIALATTPLGASLQFAIADDVPNFDIRKSCKTDVQAYQGGGNQKGCLDDEQGARQTLVGQWGQFDASSRARCVRMVSDVSGTQSYVELLTCLQIAKDAKGLPKD